MDNSNPTTQPSENQNNTSWKDALSAEDSELLQLSVNIVCKLYAKGIINYKMHHSSDETWGYTVRTVFEILKDNEVVCPLYPII